MDAQQTDYRISSLPEPAPAIDQRHFKRAMGSFATGVTLATTRSGAEWHGATANAVMSVSLEPPLVLLSIQIGSRMHRALGGSDNFALSILSTEQEGLALYFADSSAPHDTAAFARFPHHPGYTGAPLMDGALACVDCRIVDTFPAGDHMLFLGRIMYLETTEDAAPLLYMHGAFR